MTAAAWLHLVASVLLVAGPSWRLGMLLSRRWMGPSIEIATGPMAIRWRRIDRAADAIGLAGLAASLWAACAEMTGRALADVGSSLGAMLGSTAVGRTGLVGIGLLAAVMLVDSRRQPSRLRARAVLVLLLAYAFSRASVSHAGDAGLVSVDVVVEWVHLSLVSTWIGVVAAAGWLILPALRRQHASSTLAHSGDGRTGAAARLSASRQEAAARAPASRHEADARAPASRHEAAHPPTAQDGAVEHAPAPQDIAAWLRSLSRTATAAVAGILATGIVNAWERIGSLRHLVGNDYTTTLAVKLAFVAAALALGGYNRFIGFPTLARAGGAPGASAHATNVLRVESLLLLAALVAACLLASQEPPAAVDAA